MAINHLHAFVSSLIDAQTSIPESLFPHIPIYDDRNPVFMANEVDINSVINYVKAIYVRHILGVVDSPNKGWKENFISPYPDEKIANSEIMFIRRLFPEILFIINTRDPIECSKSSIWKFREDSVDEISKRKDWMISGAASGLFGDNYILLNHDEWKNDLDKLVNPLTSAGMNIDKDKALSVFSERLTHISDI